eukprot:TRINITY_DN4932_c0_g1_i3.p1 TRINITY_DN4932_c0_g1~~TRINITY_DN4932_c0_g1_i3.p1  ORF type:complete len:1008 (-),score=293.38 TRINITY_DN4932_c0_g1_i3:277-3300(-)
MSNISPPILEIATDNDPPRGNISPPLIEIVTDNDPPRGNISPPITSDESSDTPAIDVKPDNDVPMGSVSPPILEIVTSEAPMGNVSPPITSEVNEPIDTPAIDVKVDDNNVLMGKNPPLSNILGSITTHDSTPMGNISPLISAEIDESAAIGGEVDDDNSVPSREESLLPRIDSYTIDDDDDSASNVAVVGESDNMVIPEPSDLIVDVEYDNNAPTGDGTFAQGPENEQIEGLPNIENEIDSEDEEDDMENEQSQQNMNELDKNDEMINKQDDYIDEEYVDDLRSAALNCDVDKIRKMLENTTPELREKDCLSDILFTACEEGSVEVVKALVEGSRPQFRQMEYYDSTPLWAAASGGHVEIVELLIDGTDEEFRKKGYRGDTPLIAAVCEGHLEIVRILLDGSSPEYRLIPDSNGCTPLFHACDEGHLEIVELLLEEYLPNRQDTESLVVAVENDHVDIVRRLLQASNPQYREVRYFDGRTPLLRACEKGNIEMVRVLLKGSRIEYREMGCLDGTPLSYAQSNGFKEIEELLLDGARPTIHIVKPQDTPLIKAVRDGEDFFAIHRLLENQPDSYRESIGENGETALFVACKNGNTLAVHVLLMNSRPEYREIGNYRCESPLWIACFNGHFEIVKMLVIGARNGYLEKADISKITPLLAACMGKTGSRNAYNEIVQFLVTQSSNPMYREIFDIYRRSPLLVAVENGYVQIVRILLEGSRPQYRELLSNDDESLLLVAYENENSEIVELLLKDARVEFSEMKDVTFGDTLLIRAITDGDVEMAHILLNGAGRPQHKELVNEFNETALMKIVTSEEPSKWTGILPLLLEGTDPQYREIPSRSVTTPLMVASERGLTEMVEILLTDSRLEYRSIDNEELGTPLWLAAFNGHTEIVNLLIDGMGEEFKIKGKRVQLKNATPLFAAVANDHIEIARILLQDISPHSEYPELPDWEGVTPLMGAVMKENVEMVKLLVKDSRLSYRDIGIDEWKTPLHYATHKGLKEICRILKEK